VVNENDPATGATDGALLALLAKVVCGADGSEASAEALRQALRLELPATELVVAAVSETRIAVHAGARAPRVADEIAETARAALDEAKAQAPHAASRLLDGRPEDALLHLVKEEGATLVAVGSHGHRRPAGVAIGSVATRLLHDAPCSVLLARRSKDVAAFPRSIVAGVDGSSQSLQAAEVAAALGRRFRVPVTFLAATGRRADVDPEGLQASGLEIVLSDAGPISALLEAATDADLIVLGNRGLRGLRALGSVSERVAHRAGSSVLVVRHAG
jgi:nucleotide-binding universal stress UspA family protein